MTKLPQRQPQTAAPTTWVAPFVRSAASIVALTVLGFAVGCADSSSAQSGDGNQQADAHHHDHDHGHRPASYAAAIGQIKEARDSIKAAFDAGTPNECDEALHVVLEVLGVLPEVAAETDLPKDKWEVVKAQKDVLFEQMVKIHDGFHGNSEAGSSFDEVQAEIDSAIATLESMQGETGEPAQPHAGSDAHEGEHDHDDEDGHGH